MIVDIVNRWLDGVQEDLIKNYDRLRLRASGRWANSLEPFAEFTDNGVRTGILGEEYTGALTGGRKPTSGGNAGNETLKDVIRVWIDDKKINIAESEKDSLAYLIARKIHEEGIQVPNKYNQGTLIANVVNASRIDQLIQEMKLFYIDEMRATTIRNIKTTNV